MKQKILRCDNCGKETRHLVGKKMSPANGTKREIKHCCNCGMRQIKNNKNGNHTRSYANEK